MKKKKIYYHVIERGNYGNIGWHDYYLTLQEAQDRVNKLYEYFPNLSFEVFASLSKKEPEIVTV